MAQSAQALPQDSNDFVKGSPTHLWIEPTSRCNTRCIHCGHHYAQFGKDMPRELFQLIVSELLDNVTGGVELVGSGEPLLSPYFDEMLDECISRKIRVHFVSNGILLTDPKRLARLVRLPVRMYLSIDGAGPAHEFFRPYIKWEKMREALETIKQAQDAAGNELRWELGFNCVVAKPTVAGLPSLIELAHHHGAKVIQLLPLGGEEMFEKIKGQSLEGSPELLVGPLKQAIALARKHNIPVYMPGTFSYLLANWPPGKAFPALLRRNWNRLAMLPAFLKRQGIKRAWQRSFELLRPKTKPHCNFCSYPWDSTYFSAEGTLHPCCIIGDPLGNLAAESWQDIWNGPPYRNLRRTIHSWNPTHMCRYCFFPAGINGGDDKNYDRFFEKFKRTEISISDPSVKFGEGFFGLEYRADGSISHNWMGKSGTLELPMQKGARFLRFHIIARAPIPAINPGRCRINGGEWEYFDNSCMEITFPLGHVKNDDLRVEFEMENATRPEGGDPRQLGLAIHAIFFLN